MGAIRNAPPSSRHATLTMRANRRRDSGPELALRSALHALGLRYRVDQRIDAPPRRPRPDVVFSRARVAVFVDGCFWHACPVHGELPVANRQFWQDKLSANVARDRADDLALVQAGWVVVRVWEHEDPAEAAQEIVALVRKRREG